MSAALERFLPAYDVSERHETIVRADAERVDAAVRSLDLGDSRVARALFRLRGMPARARRLDGLSSMGFEVLADEPGRALVLGLIGRFWTLRGGLCRFEPSAFASFDSPGFAKAVWSFELEPAGPGATRLATETRVACTDPVSRRRFARYWLLVRPFSGVIRRVALRDIRRRAEAAAR